MNIKKLGPQRISDLHPSLMAMQYPLLFPHGEDGYRLRILHRNLTQRSMAKHDKLMMREYYAFRLQQQMNERHTLLWSGRLFQQYIVGAYMVIEEERFRWIRQNQKKLQADLYKGLMDAFFRGDTSAEKIGKTKILPSSHCRSPQYQV